MFDPYVATNGKIRKIKTRYIAEGGTIVEIAAVIHGRWRWNEYGQMFCSVCEQFPELAIEKPYCSSCGAKMDL